MTIAPISNEVLIAAISAFATISIAFFAYLTAKLREVKKLVDGTATLLAAQTQKNTEKALEVTEQRVAEAKEGNANESMTENTKEIASNTREIANNTTK